MTVANANRKDQYTGNGSATVFNYNYKIFKQSELEVTLKNVNGVESLLTLTTHYSVSGVNNESGGSITMVTAPVTGETLTIKRVVVEDQQTDLRNQGAWLPETVEDELDKSRMIDLQQREDLDRTPKLPISSSVSGLVFPDSPSPGSKFFRWNAAGTALELVTASDAGFNTIMLPVMQVGSPIYGTGSVSFGQVGSVKYASAYADFATAVSTIGATITTLIVSENETVSTIVTAPSTLKILVEGAGGFTKSGSGAITFNGSFEATTNGVFTGFSTGISFGLGSIREILPQWWVASASGGLIEAYAASPPAGSRLLMTTDITISAAQTLTTTTGKPMILDMGGRTIFFSHTSGVGLTLFKPDVNPRDIMSITNGIHQYTGVSLNVTGVQLGSTPNPATNVLFSDLAFNGFAASGSAGLYLLNTQDSHFDNISYAFNNIALKTGIDTNQNSFSNNWFQANTVDLSVTDSMGLTFSDCLFQTSSSVNPIQIRTLTGLVFHIRFKDCWFENNGDGTAGSAQILFANAAGKTIRNISFENNRFEGVTNGQSGVVYAFNGVGTLDNIYRKHNYYKSFAAGMSSGLTSANDIVSIHEHFESPLVPETFIGTIIKSDSTLSTAKAITSILATGTAPFSITSRTAVPNLRVEGLDIVLTASLPAAGASQDGKVLIEDGGAGNRNLVVYGGGQRFRINGGAAF